MATVVDSYSESNSDTSYAIGANTIYTKDSQSFTGNGGILNSVKYYLKKFGSATGNISVKIYAETHVTAFGTDSLPTGAALATADGVDASTLTGSLTLKTFTFSGDNKITLSNGTYYVVSVEYYRDVSGTYILFGCDESSPSHAGNGSRWISTSWAVATFDACFYVYKDDPTTSTTSSSSSTSTTSSSISTSTTSSSSISTTSSSSSTSTTSSSSSISTTSSSISTSTTSSSSTSTTSSSSSTSSTSTSNTGTISTTSSSSSSTSISTTSSSSSLSTTSSSSSSSTSITISTTSSSTSTSLSTTSSSSSSSTSTSTLWYKPDIGIVDTESFSGAVSYV